MCDGIQVKLQYVGLQKEKNNKQTKHPPSFCLNKPFHDPKHTHKNNIKDRKIEVNLY